MKHHNSNHHMHENSHAHTHNHAHHMEDLKKRFIFSLLITIPILLLSPMIWDWFGFRLDIPYRKFIIFTLSSFIYFYGGKPFLTGAIKEIKEKNPGMMTLISMAISVAFFYSSFSLFFEGGKEFFWELATLIDIMLIGHYIEAKSILGASNALEELVKLIPKKAHKIIGSKIEDTDVNELKIGDTILIKPGEKIPSDGVVIDGQSSVDESFLTGESKPVFKTKDNKVFMGSTNLDGILKVKILKSGNESYLAQVIKLVKDAQMSRSKTQDFANKAAKWLFYGASLAGTITFLYWMPLLGTSKALLMSVTVLIIACPHALGLAVPLVVAISTTLGAKHGILIRDREAFERLKDIDVICLDKTGTITEGKLKVEKIVSIIDEKELLTLAANVEQNSEHTIAKAIVDYAKEKGIVTKKIENFKIYPGIGAKAQSEGDTILIGGSKLLENFGLKIPNNLKQFEKSSYTKVWVAKNKSILGIILLKDRVRKDSKTAISNFKNLGIKTYMLTGDNEEIAKEIAKNVGIDKFYANLMPDDKVKIIENLKKEGKIVAMVGDGINDAPSLLSSNVGIAIGAGTDIAAQSADIILTKNSLKDVIYAIKLSLTTYKKMVQNIWWASGYNIVAIPLAAGVLYGYGILINPALGAVLMSASTVVVAVNAQFLKRFKPDEITTS